MKITKAWVEKWKPCEKAVKLAAGHGFTLGSDDVEVAEFFAKRDFAWANATHKRLPGSFGNPT